MAGPPIHQLPVLSEHATEIMIDAARRKAQEIGIDMNIAIVDATLHLKHFLRMQHAKLTSIAIAIDKAYTAAGHKNPTQAYVNNKLVLPGGSAYGIHNSNGGRFTLIAGGVPVKIEGAVVGAIGVSSGTPEQDTVVASAAVEALEAWVKKRGGPKL